MDIVDELLHVAVGCREAGVSKQECFDIVRDVFDAPWSNDVIAPSLIRRVVEQVFSRPRAREGCAMTEAE